MEKFNIYSKETIADLISERSGEIKFGQRIQFVSALEELKSSSAKFVIFGVPEDIGIRANYGKPGAVTAWNAFLPAFLNIQKNRYNFPGNCILLGELDCDEWMKQASEIFPYDTNYHENLGKLVSEIDEVLSEIVGHIISEKKVPIIIGGGHNNAFGNIKGTSEVLKKPINVLNIDAHTDLRSTEYRHSGNGFSKAIQENFLKKYAVFGLHENYTPETIFRQMESNENIEFQLFEDLLNLTCEEKKNELKKEIDFLEKEFGLEIDCDCMANFPSSALTPSGFSLNELRAFVRMLNQFNPHYLHLCEASAENEAWVGKALAYLVSDFMQETIFD
ncbi:MAG TPA: formimidoylglutamase [Flavobacteriaceae bacterium]|nr:formimidoylglutamase [Flavobacteriaceae bacterium]